MLRRTADWLEQARGEFKAARDLYSTGNHAWCCFACQQAAEKALKALLEHFGTPAVGHNLLALIAEVEKHVEVPDDVKRACRILNRYYISTRYPNAFPSGAPIHMFDEEDSRQALELAVRVLNFAENTAKTA